MAKPLVFRIKSLNNQIKRLFDKSAIYQNDANLTGMQYAMIGFIYRHEKCDVFQRDVEREFNIRRSTASSMLKYLEQEDYIERVSFPGDARLKKLITTEKGRKLRAKSEENITKIEQQLTYNISEEDLNHFYKVMKQISDNANSE